MQLFHFYKNSSGWFIDLPEYIAQGGFTADLQMVDGADSMLDIISGNEETVSVIIGSEHFDQSDKLELVEVCDPAIGGGYYVMEKYAGTTVNQRMWLCAVTTFVFGHLPENIFIRRAYPGRVL